MKLTKNNEITDFLRHFSLTIIFFLVTLNLGFFEYNFDIVGLIIIPLITALICFISFILSLVDINLYFEFKNKY